MKINFVENRSIWYTFSAVLMVASLIFVVAIGLKFGIDFTGGSLVEVQFAQEVSTADVRGALEGAGFKNISLQETDGNGMLIRTIDMNEDQHQTLLSSLKGFEGVEELRFDSIGPVIGNELRRTATWGLIVTLVLIGLYIAWAFRKVSAPVESWKYGSVTIFKALHDVFIMIGAYALLGYFLGWEVDTAFVAAVLTILGYSINDVVVVLDRTRENLQRHVAETFEKTVEISIEQTLSRSLNTSVTVVLALLAISLFGGTSTRPFAVALMVGIVTATYSSVFIASELLVTWELRRKK